MGIRQFFFYSAALLLLLLGATVVTGTDAPLKQDPQIFTNQDIKKYDATAEAGPSSISPRAAEHAGQTSRAKDERDMERWCKKATPHHRNISRIKEEIQEIEGAQSAEKEKGVMHSRRERSRTSKLDKLRKRLMNAEKDLGALENEAHRKRIPPGWLRCQFE